jgi:hypothetical protein
MEGSMEKGKIGYLIISSAVVWGAVIIGCAMVLKGTPYKDNVSLVVLGGAVFHLLFIWAPLGKQFRKKEDKTDSK